MNKSSPNKKNILIFLIAKSAKIIVLGMIAFFTSCEQHPKCWGENKNKGVIIEEVLISCPPTIHNDRYVITSDSMYKSLFGTSCPVPEIDFTQVNLLGFFTANSACNSKYIREVLVHKTEPYFEYNITVRNCGFCFDTGFNFNWVTVPRIPQGWTVKFNVTTK